MNRDDENWKGWDSSDVEYSDEENMEDEYSDDDKHSDDENGGTRLDDTVGPEFGGVGMMDGDGFEAGINVCETKRRGPPIRHVLH